MLWSVEYRIAEVEVSSLHCSPSTTGESGWRARLTLLQARPRPPVNLAGVTRLGAPPRPDR